MRFLALALVLLSFSVHAELYRWIDRASGSIIEHPVAEHGLCARRRGVNRDPSGRPRPFAQELDRLDPSLR